MVWLYRRARYVMSLASKLFISGGSGPTGEQVFTSSGNWTAPKGVYRVSAVCIGGGGNGFRRIAGSTSSEGGGAGGLGWSNDIAVVPQQNYIVRITSAGSYFISINTVWGQIGQTPSSTSSGSQGGVHVGDGGGDGGAGHQANVTAGPPVVVGGGGSTGNYNSNGNDGNQNTYYGITQAQANAGLGKGSGSNISGNDVGNYGYGGTEYVSGTAGVVQLRWGINKDFS